MRISSFKMQTWASGRPLAICLVVMIFILLISVSVRYVIQHEFKNKLVVIGRHIIVIPFYRLC